MWHPVGRRKDVSGALMRLHLQSVLQSGVYQRFKGVPRSGGDDEGHRVDHAGAAAAVLLHRHHRHHPDQRSEPGGGVQPSPGVLYTKFRV